MPMSMAPKLELEQQKSLPISATNSGKAKLVTKNLNFFYGCSQALHEISLEIPKLKTTLQEDLVNEPLQSLRTERI